MTNETILTINMFICNIYLTTAYDSECLEGY